MTDSPRTAQAIIYVLDSGDQLRLVVAKDEFQRLLKHPGNLASANHDSQTVVFSTYFRFPVLRRPL